MSNLTLTCKDGGDFKPHPEGIHPAVCVDVMDLGLVETEFQGQKSMKNKLKLVFESEQKTEDGKACTVSRSFTASLHPKAKLAEFLGKWRGRPLVLGETIELGKLLHASCTLVISHEQSVAGKTYASIDAISKPTRKVTASGQYDPAAARQRYAEWKAKQQAVPAPNAAPAAVATPLAGAIDQSVRRTSSGFQPPSPQGGEGNKSGAALAATPAGTPASDYDPEVGF